MYLFVIGVTVKMILVVVIVKNDVILIFHLNNLWIYCVYNIVVQNITYKNKNPPASFDLITKTTN